MLRLRHSVAWRLTIWFLLLSFLPIGTMLIFVRNTVADAFAEQVARDSQSEAALIAQSLAALPTDDSRRQLIASFSKDRQLVAIVGRDGSFAPEAGSAAPGSVRDYFGASASSRVLSDPTGYAVDRITGRIVGFAAIPGSDSRVVVVRQDASVDSTISQMETSSIVQLAVSLIVVAVVGGLAIWVLIGPIQRLTSAAERVGAGDLTIRLDPTEMEGELETLAIAFNKMTQQLGESHDLLERRVEDRTRELAALNAISAVVSHSLSIYGIMNAAIEKIVEVMGMDVGAAYRLEGNPPILRLLAWQGILRARAEELVSLPVDQGATLQAVRSMRITERRISDYAPGVMRDILEAEGLKLVVGLPLLAKGQTVGAISVGSRSERTITDDDRALLEAIGQQVGVAVENARLYEQAEEAAVAAERNRLARDLHDAVTQTLFSASLIAEVLPRLWKRNTAEGERRLEELRQLTRGALAEMRTLLLELRPNVLVDTPLVNLLRHLADATTGRARVPVSLAVEGDSALPADVRIALYRIAQEALNNVAKHANATEATITLRQSPTLTELIVQDDGQGFDPATVKADHLGLGIMRERARALGATCQIESTLGVGSTITVRWSAPDRKDLEAPALPSGAASPAV